MKNKQLSNSSLKRLRELNKDYEGALQYITFVVLRDKEQKKIFKWIFQKGKVDIIVAFPYYKCQEYHCGIVNVPSGKPGVKNFNAVKNGKSSEVPVKFSYHLDGNVHFKPNSKVDDKSFKLATIKGIPLAKFNGHKLFQIYFEGLEKFEEYSEKQYKDGEEKAFLPVDSDIQHFELVAYAGPTEESVSGKIQKGMPPVFLAKAEFEGRKLFVGFYVILSRRSRIVDDNKNSLTAFVGFEETNSGTRSLYLFAR